MPKIKTTARKNKLSHVVVRPRSGAGAPHLARLHAGPVTIPASIGRSGVSFDKREGDGKSPAGAFRLINGFRRESFPRGPTLLPLAATRRAMGWCDDPRSGRYNRPVAAGAPVSHERLWRDDGLYDVVVVTDHNQIPRRLGRGSAIFFHLMRADGGPTEGCVAIARDDMRRLLPRLARRVRLIIRP